MATAFEFQIATICSSCGMASMCSLMKDMPGSTSMANIFITVNITLVSRSQISMCNEMLALVLSRSFDANRLDGITPLDTLSTQSVGRNSFEIKFGYTPVSRRQVTGCVIFFEAPYEMRMKYAERTVTVAIRVDFRT